MGEHKHKKRRTSGSSRKRSRSWTTVLIVLAVVGAVIGIDVIQNNQKSPLSNFVTQKTKGNEGAPIKIVEFLDFQCSHCKNGSEFLRESMMLHPDLIQLTLKYYPLGQLNSSMSAYYAECAARQEKFWDMHDKLFETQDDWRTLLKIKPFFNRLVADIGLDQAKFDSCVDSKSVKSTVSKDKAVGDSYSLRSTPTYFINGEMIVGVHSLKKVINEYIEKEGL